jgi:hypothetical protein
LESLADKLGKSLGLGNGSKQALPKEWISSKEASELTGRMGSLVTAPTISKAAAKNEFESRKAEPGTKTRLEVEFTSFVAWFSKKYQRQSS